MSQTEKGEEREIREEKNAAHGKHMNCNPHMHILGGVGAGCWIAEKEDVRQGRVDPLRSAASLMYKRRRISEKQER